MTITNQTSSYINQSEQNIKKTKDSDFDKTLEAQKTESTQASSSIQKTENTQKEYFYNVLTYENTKGMTEEDINKYFPDKSKEEKEQISFMVHISKNFSESDAANKAIFEEAKTKTSLVQRQQFSIEMAIETEAFLLGEPRINNVFRVTGEYAEALKRGIDPRSEGIYANSTQEAISKHGNLSYNEHKLSASEVENYIVSMYKLSKQRMDEARGSEVFENYKEAFQRYENIYNNYLDNLKGQSIHV